MHCLQLPGQYQMLKRFESALVEYSKLTIACELMELF